MEVIDRIFLTVFPLFAIVLVGFLYGRSQHPDIGFANRVNMDIFTPALIFDVLAVKSFSLSAYHSLALAGAAVILGSGLLLWPLARLFRLNTRTFLPPMMFNNSGNLGIPLIVLAFGEAALPAAVILFVIQMGLHMTVGVYMLDHRTSPTQVIRSPMILAALAGVLFSQAGWSIPEVMALPISMLGQVSIPLMLFTLGIRIAEVGINDWRLGSLGAMLCPLSGLAVVLLLGPWLGLPAEQFSALVLFSVLPPAVLNYIVAERYNQEPHQVASIVLVGNLGSLVFIPITLAFLL